ncbi:MAG TPA: ATP-binding protein [Devosiaceae bacterium]|jgi:two-component system phosphate regulon sensor histidine kinase PhoR
MNQDTSQTPAATGPRWLDAFLRRLPLLALIAIVLLVAAVFGGASYAAMAVAFVVIALGMVALPGDTGAKEAAAAETGGFDALRDAQVTAFADALGDPCLLLNRRGLIVHRNAIAARQFPNSRPGDPLAFSFRTPAMLTTVDAALKTDLAQTVELHQTGPTETWYRVNAAPLHLAGSDLPAVLFVVTLQNLTDQKRAEQMRSDFIANASHELRTPLTSLIGFIDTLVGPAARDQAARERFLGIMRSQAQRMSKLIDDLLSLSRIEMHQHVLPSGSVDLTTLLREVADGLQPLAVEAGVKLNLKLPEGGTTVTGERDELYEVVENLVENAISYGGGGGRVDIDLAPLKGQPEYDYSITVTDYGAGVAPQHVPRLTERFYRVDAESSRKKKGTGLGLAIVKHILQRHRGILTIKSKQGEGTRAEVLLPR